MGCAYRRVGLVDESVRFLKLALKAGENGGGCGLPLLNLGAVYSQINK